MVDQPFGNFERAAINADVFANHKDRRVALHLFPDAGADCFHHCGHAAARRAFRFTFFFDCG
jgi:hypothetical protein